MESQETTATIDRGQLTSEAISSSGGQLPPGGILAVGLPSHTGISEASLAKAAARAVSRLTSGKKSLKGIES